MQLQFKIASCWTFIYYMFSVNRHVHSLFHTTWCILFWQQLCLSLLNYWIDINHYDWPFAATFVLFNIKHLQSMWCHCLLPIFLMKIVYQQCTCEVECKLGMLYTARYISMAWY